MHYWHNWIHDALLLIHRTDIEGTIILSSDGKNISIRTEKTDTNREEKKNY